MITRDLHTHTTFCDGKNTPEQMIEAAISLKMKCIGFSAHSYTHFDERYCLKMEHYDSYKSEIDRLKREYQEKIKVLCGVEQDFYSNAETNGFDYIIGSVHYLKKGDKYYAVDESLEGTMLAIKEAYGGDPLALAEDYFDTVSKIIDATNADIIGHFDLITKFDSKQKLFDASHPRYVVAYERAVKKLVSYNKPFEINTGAMLRTSKTEPYPSLDIIKCIKENGGRFLLSSDSHSKEGLCHNFDKFEEFCK